MLKLIRIAIPALVLAVAPSTADAQEGATDCSNISFWTSSHVDRATEKFNGEDFHRVRTEVTKIIGWCNANYRRCRQRFERKYGWQPRSLDSRKDELIEKFSGDFAAAFDWVFYYEFEYDYDVEYGGDRSVFWWIDCTA